MNALNPYIALAGDRAGYRPAADALAEPILRYRGFAYRRSNPPAARSGTFHSLVYRGVAYRCMCQPRAVAPAPGQRRYRGVAH